MPRRSLLVTRRRHPRSHGRRSRQTIAVNTSVGRAVRRAWLAAVLVIGLASTGCAAERDTTPKRNETAEAIVAAGATTVLPVSDRMPAPPVTGELLGGQPFEPVALNGQVVVVNFWASWCAPCRREAPELERTYHATRKLGVQFIGIDVRDDRQAARDFQADFEASFPSLYDRQGRLAPTFRGVPPTTLPTTIVIDRQGRVAAVFRRVVRQAELEPVVRRIADEVR